MDTGNPVAAADTGFVTDATLPARLDALRRMAAHGGRRLAVERIGASRDGRDLWALEIGDGPEPVGITAGAHADEPTGPIAAFALAGWLLTAREAGPLLACHTFRICPQVNPDGAARNASWFSDPVDPLAYLRGVARELPGDDVEFGYPDPAAEAGGGDDPGVRPENRAVAAFLARSRGYAFHASLHSMATAEGAWFLIGREWAGRTAPLREALAGHAARLGFALHDVERHGEKGFTRIAPGFCTTPRSDAMRAHFLAEGDPAMAARFRLNSMEFVQRLGGDPLVMVSEIPLFEIAGAAGRPDPPPAGATAHDRLRAELPGARRALLEGDDAPARRLVEEHRFRPVAVRPHVELQVRMVLEALAFLAARGPGAAAPTA